MGDDAVFWLLVVIALELLIVIGLAYGGLSIWARDADERKPRK